MSIQRAPHATGASSLPHRLYRKLALKASATEDLRASSRFPTQQARLKSTLAVCRNRPFSGPTAAGVVHVITAENIGVSTWVSQTFDIPHTILILY
jgi:hypothetical protein